MAQLAPNRGWIDLATEAAFSAAIEPSIDLTLHESRDAKLSDSSPATDSEPPAPVPIESDWAPIMEFTSMDIFQHSLSVSKLADLG